MGTAVAAGATTVFARSTTGIVTRSSSESFSVASASLARGDRRTCDGTGGGIVRAGGVAVFALVPFPGTDRMYAAAARPESVVVGHTSSYSTGVVSTTGVARIAGFDAGSFTAFDRTDGVAAVTPAGTFGAIVLAFVGAGVRIAIVGFAPPAILGSGGAAIGGLSAARRGMERSFEDSFDDFILVAMRRAPQDHATPSCRADSSDVGVNAGGERGEGR